MGVMLLLLLGFSIVAYSCKQGQMISGKHDLAPGHVALQEQM
jgi:hypothetical protein